VQYIDELETPTPVVDLDIVEANLRKMQAYVASHGLRFRPHIKTHKVPELALRQVQLGAQGITCQKLGEAEVMADAGISSILLSYPLVGIGKTERLGSLASRIQMTVAVDSPEALETASRSSQISGAEIGVLVEFDSGAGRTGVVTAAEALDLATTVLETRGLRFDGLMTYPLTEQSSRFFGEAASLFARAGIEIPAFSGAGTPEAWSSHLTPGLTEVRHGSYIYHDRTSVGAGAATLAECALHMLATVVSRPTPERFILDCGSKSLSSDRVPEPFGKGFGLILECPHAVIERLYEEHALATVQPGEAAPRIGERVRVVPNHVCPVSNLHDEVAIARGVRFEGFLRVAARGKTR
jgi:D-serine deaminase-like pyridoxal phosphate-dependent protein